MVLSQIVTSQDAELSLRQMSTFLSVRLSVGLMYLPSFWLALGEHRAQKIREGEMVSVFLSIPRLGTASRGQ